MKRAQLILAVSMALFLSGCVLRGKQSPKVSAAPPAPVPVAKPAPGPPPQPLSIPQTQAELPSAQPISPEALATTRPSPPPVETPVEPRTSRRPAGPVAVSPRNETPAVPAQTPPAEAEQRPPVQEIVPAGESKRLQESADARKQEIRRILEQAQARALSRDQRALLTRIQSFVQLSDEAEKRGDMRQADDLAERAQVLVRELQNGGR